MSDSDRSRLARVRETFLSTGEIGQAGLVNPAIEASWLRSLHQHVDPDLLDPVFVDKFNKATPLAQSAEQVLKPLADELANEPVSVVLTDASGIILQRLCVDATLARAMDSSHVAPGFNYAEEQVGTNGIGTALERRAPTLVNGGEHFTDSLATFTCAGVPVLHPINGAVLGVLNLTSLQKDSNSLLLAVAKSTVHRIQQQLLSSASARELALFTDYVSACRRGGGSILALGADTVMMNTHARTQFDADDRAALLARSSDADGAVRPMTFLADLPSGVSVRMEYRPAFDNRALAGGVFRIHANAAPDRPAVQLRSTLPTPGAVGSSAIWKRACQTVQGSHRRGEWLALEGEAGVGKLTLLRGVHHLRDPAGRFRVIEAASLQDPATWLKAVDEELTANRGTLVLRRVHLLPPHVVHELSQILTRHQPRPTIADHPWVAMTMRVNPRSAEVDAQLLPQFPRTVEVPPLRHHMDDVRALVDHLLGQINRDNTLTLSPAAMNQLMRMPWPGNVEHLRQVLVRVSHKRRTGVVGVDDLPPECRSTSRRQLTKMESLERDAICTSLMIHRGSKQHAAEDLGMSRSTIYRKIREYGITWAPGQSDHG